MAVLLSPECWYYRSAPTCLAYCRPALIAARVGVKVAIIVLCFNVLTNTDHTIEGYPRLVLGVPSGLQDTPADIAVVNDALLDRDWSQGTCDPKLQLLAGSDPLRGRSINTLTVWSRLGG